MRRGVIQLEEVYKTISYGKLTIRNVPHLYNNGKIFADGSDVILDGAVVYNLAKILHHMVSHKIKDIEYEVINEIKG